ncbi:MAG: hypothetical protein Q8R92_03020, partial [Deltaproteobacteria bacterium]|nr:hypothetical protein [Deltaproteobacteria bacterium]
KTFQQQAQSHQELLGDYAQLQAYDNHLAQYKDVDWAKLEEEDPLAAQRHYRAYQQVRDARTDQVEAIRAKEQERSQVAQREAAKRAEEYRNALTKEIKDWSPELNLKLTQFARSLGYTDQEIAAIRDVRAVKLMREAYEGAQVRDKLRKTQRDAVKPKPKTEVKPLTKPAQGRAPARTGLTDDLPIDEWQRQRNKQVAAKRDY